MTRKSLFFRPDLTEYLTEDFVKYYDVDTTCWLNPKAYYIEKENSIGSDSGVPDGSYILIGHIEYTSICGKSRHKIGQFAGLKVEGLNLIFSSKLHYYPNCKGLDIDPIYALFLVGKNTEFNKLKSLVEDLNKSPVSLDYIKYKISQCKDFNSLESKVYRLRMALQKQITGFTVN